MISLTRHFYLVILGFLVFQGFLNSPEDPEHPDFLVDPEDQI
jgi:hypothetical protein